MSLNRNAGKVESAGESMSEQALRNRLIRLAHSKPELRDDLLPLLAGKQAASSDPADIAWEIITGGPRPILRELWKTLDKKWTRRELEAEAAKIRKKLTGGRGRKPLPAVVKSVNAWKRFVNPKRDIFGEMDLVDEEQAADLLKTINVRGSVQCGASRGL